MSTAQSAEPTGTLTLVCQGERTFRAFKSGRAAPTREPISMGIIVNFPTYGTVEGIQSIRGYIVLIDETKAVFNGNDKMFGSISGNIDRVTGAVSAEWTPSGRTNLLPPLRRIFWRHCKSPIMPASVVGCRAYMQHYANFHFRSCTQAKPGRNCSSFSGRTRVPRGAISLLPAVARSLRLAPGTLTLANLLGMPTRCIARRLGYTSQFLHRLQLTPRVSPRFSDCA